MTTGLLSIGASALDAAYTALRTTGNNIANVNTPGYSREVTSFTPLTPDYIGGGMYVGSGVGVASVSRLYSDLLGQQTNMAQAQASQADTAAQLTTQIDNMFSNSTTGLGSAIDNFFTQVQALSAQPGSAATRQTTLAAAQQMSDQFNSAYAQLQAMTQSTQQQIGQEISTVNGALSQIAGLNDQIALATAGGQTPNNLLDQRNQAILTLNQSIGVTTTTQSNGAVNIYLANGEPLLVGDHVTPLAMATDPTNPRNIVVGAQEGGTIAPLDSSQTGGGAIGALLQFNNLTVPSVQNQIGQLAVTLSSQFNAIQAQGLTPSGASGTAFFSTPTIAVSAASTNTDTATVAASYSNVTQLQASDYQLAIEGSGASASYVLTRESDGTQVATGAVGATGTTISADGMTLTLGTAPASGDLFTISPVRNGAQAMSVAIGQGSQIAAASPLAARLGAANAGSLSVGNLAPQSLPNNFDANLLQTVTLNFTSPTQYTYTYTPAAGGAAVTSATQTYTAGQAIDINGWALTLQGSPANGDSVTVAANASVASLSGDNRNAQLMAQLQGQSIVNGNTLDGAYAAVVANVGTLASTANTDQASKDAILNNATNAESSYSGVNLDEEAANLLRYQQQYQAAAQMIQTANSIFSTVLSAVQSA